MDTQAWFDEYARRGLDGLAPMLMALASLEHIVVLDGPERIAPWRIAQMSVLYAQGLRMLAPLGLDHSSLWPTSLMDGRTPPPGDRHMVVWTGEAGCSRAQMRGRMDANLWWKSVGEMSKDEQVEYANMAGVGVRVHPLDQSQRVPSSSQEAATIARAKAGNMMEMGFSWGIDVLGLARVDRIEVAQQVREYGFSTTDPWWQVWGGVKV